MARTYNPFTKRLDKVGSTGTENAPVTGSGNPNGVVISRYAGDQYIDTVTGLLYMNPVVGDTGREVIMTAPGN